jgi:HTH-type transcriptional regulator, competence development regulator
MPAGERNLGAHLRELRTKLGWTLRDVEAKAGGRINNAYLSQIESGKVAAPSVELLAVLAETYGVDLWELMYQAGWVGKRVPADGERQDGSRRRIPANVLDELTEDEIEELIAYADFLKARRGRRPANTL